MHERGNLTFPSILADGLDMKPSQTGDQNWQTCQFSGSGLGDRQAGTVQNALGTDGRSGSSVIQLPGATEKALLGPGRSVQHQGSQWCEHWLLGLIAWAVVPLWDPTWGEILDLVLSYVVLRLFYGFP